MLQLLRIYHSNVGRQNKLTFINRTRTILYTHSADFTITVYSPMGIINYLRCDLLIFFIVSLLKYNTDSSNLFKTHALIRFLIRRKNYESRIKIFDLSLQYGRNRICADLMNSLMTGLIMYKTYECI